MTKAHDELNDRHENAKTHNTAKKTKHNTDEVSAGMTSEDNSEEDQPAVEMAEAQDNLKAAEEKYNELQNSLKEAEEKTHDLHDKYLRLSAEFDNYRKRTVREKAELIKTASEDILMKIIPVLDDLERGIQAVENAKDTESLKQGMFLIYNRFRDFLSQNGITEIEAMHQEFNTDVHEAVSKMPAQDENLKGKVLDVVQKGYLLHEKVLRYSKVVVGE